MASVSADKILVIDLEGTCDDVQPLPFNQEIIEIGLAVVDVKKLEVVDKQTTFVVPTTSYITPFCTNLTTITSDMVQAKNGARRFPDAINWLKKFGTKNRVWGSWGDFDRKLFERQCRRENVEYPFGPCHMNIKMLMAVLEGHSKGVGVAEAVEYYGLEWYGTHHRGIDDAVNIANVLIEIRKRFSAFQK